jgi:hypothetical protein
MTTERQLDARLTAAGGIRDEDLPALPEEFLAELVADAREVRSAPLSRRRRVAVRSGVALLVAAAAAVTAVVVVHEDAPRAVPSPATVPPTDGPVDPPGGLVLVAAQAVTFPYSLDPAPSGLTPVLTRTGGLEMFGAIDPVVYSARYGSAGDPGFAFSVSAHDPRVPLPGVEEAPPYSDDEVDDRGTVPVGGRPADFVSATLDEPDCDYVPSTPTQEEEPERLCSDAYAELTWQRADGLWVSLVGHGDRYGQVPALVSVGGSIVDRPQPVQLQFGLAPVGWTVSSYESLGNLTLVSDAAPTDPSQRVGVSLLERWRGYDSPDVVLEGMTDGNPVEQVTVNGEPARLVSVPDHAADPASGKRMWYLAAQFAGGPQFLLQAPDTLSRDDVLAMAGRLTYTP